MILNHEVTDFQIKSMTRCSGWSQTCPKTYHVYLGQYRSLLNEEVR